MLLALVITGCGDAGGGATSPAISGSATTTSAATPTSTDSSATTLPTGGSSGHAETSTRGTGSTGGDGSTGGTDPTSGGPTVTATSGDTGDPGTGGDAPGVCQEACTTDRDCLVDGSNAGFVCKNNRCFPDNLPNQCHGDLFCQVGLLSAFHYCDMSADCGDTGVCIDIEGDPSLCAYFPDAMNQCPYPIVQAVVELPTVEGEDRSVCITTYVECDPPTGLELSHYCSPIFGPCGSNSDCNGFASTPVCGDEGTCICTEDAQCSVPGQPTCIDGRCSCTSDADCVVLGSADVCVDGTCGCSSAAVCPTETQYDGTHPVCEPL